MLNQAEDFKGEGDRILNSFHEWVEAGADGASGWALEKDYYEGYRVNVDEGEGKQGWLLLRASLHDPLLVLNVESDRTGGEHMQIVYDLACISTGVSCYALSFPRAHMLDLQLNKPCGLGVFRAMQGPLSCVPLR